MKNALRLGTRRSLLARAQSAWVAREVEKHNPGMSVELVGIDTRGDKILDIPLSQIEGKEFFVAEIDKALLEKKVDFTVHSLKDLSLERPDEITLGAIPKRENSRDVILFCPEILETLKKGQSIKLGTSSPRRLENIPPFLKQALPQFEKEPKLQFEQIRGNVNTRLGRLYEQGERKLDGVVLAFAGLIRLWRDEEARKEMKPLLEKAKWMVLPLSHSPSAPAQGALAVECRKEDSDTFNALQKIHSLEAAAQVKDERAVLQKYGGGCHQKFGASSLNHSKLKGFQWIRGESTNGEKLNQFHWERPPRPTNSTSQVWCGSEHRNDLFESREMNNIDLKNSDSPIFIAHSRAMPKLDPEQVKNRIWTSGVKSWVQLAKRGFWVEGCGESLGWEWLKETVSEEVLQLPQTKDWCVLTHEEAKDTWNEENVIPTYQVVLKNDAAAKEALKKAEGSNHFFWTSRLQFEAVKDRIPKDAHHACGPGKTEEFLASQGLTVDLFPNVEEWKKWLKTN